MIEVKWKWMRGLLGVAIVLYPLLGLNQGSVTLWCAGRVAMGAIKGFLAEQGRMINRRFRHEVFPDVAPEETRYIIESRVWYFGFLVGCFAVVLGYDPCGALDGSATDGRLCGALAVFPLIILHVILSALTFAVVYIACLIDGGFEMEPWQYKKLMESKSGSCDMYPLRANRRARDMTSPGSTARDSSWDIEDQEGNDNEEDDAEEDVVINQPPRKSSRVTSPPVRSYESDDTVGLLEAQSIQDDEIPERFMRATNGDLEEARRRWAVTSKWRRDNDVDKIINEPQPFFETIKNNYPHCYHGTTKDGYPLYIERPGYFKYRELIEAGVTREAMLRHEVYLAEYFWNIDQQNDQHAKLVCLLDVEGLKFTDLTGEAMDFVRSVIKLTSDHYVERCARATIINVPGWFHIIWKMVKVLLDDSTRAKVVIVGGRRQNVLKVLDETIGLENIPPELGGTSQAALGESETERRLFEFTRSLNARFQTSRHDGECSPTIDDDRCERDVLPATQRPSGNKWTSWIMPSSFRGTYRESERIRSEYRSSWNFGNFFHDENQAFLGEDNKFVYDDQTKEWVLQLDTLEDGKSGYHHEAGEEYKSEHLFNLGQEGQKVHKTTSTLSGEDNADELVIHAIHAAHNKDVISDHHLRKVDMVHGELMPFTDTTGSTSISPLLSLVCWWLTLMVFLREFIVFYAWKSLSLPAVTFSRGSAIGACLPLILTTSWFKRLGCTPTLMEDESFLPSFRRIVSVGIIFQASVAFLPEFVHEDEKDGNDAENEQYWLSWSLSSIIKLAILQLAISNIHLGIIYCHSTFLVANFNTSSMDMGKKLMDFLCIWNGESLAALLLACYLFKDVPDIIGSSAFIGTAVIGFLQIIASMRMKRRHREVVNR